MDTALIHPLMESGGRKGVLSSIPRFLIPEKGSMDVQLVLRFRKAAYSHISLS